MLTFALRFAAFAVAFSFVCAPQTARASPTRAQILVSTELGDVSLEDRYIVGSTLELVAELPDVPFATSTVFGASSNIARTSVTTTELSTVETPDAVRRPRHVTSTVLLRDVGFVDLYVTTSDGGTTFARATIEVVPCESVEFAADPEGPWTPDSEVRVSSVSGGARIAVACTYDGLPTADFGVLSVHQEGRREDCALVRNRVGRHVFVTGRIANFETLSDRYYSEVAGIGLESLAVVGAGYEEPVTMKLVPSGWSGDGRWIDLHARLVDAGGHAFVGVPIEITIGGREPPPSWTTGRIELVEDGPVVPVCAYARGMHDCIAINARVPEYPHGGGGYSCAVARATDLASFWPLALGVLCARRMRRDCVRGLRARHAGGRCRSSTSTRSRTTRPSAP